VLLLLSACAGAAEDDGGPADAVGQVEVVFGDGQGAADTGAAADAGTVTDAGTAIDAGTANDAGTATDAGAGAGTDTGTAIDAEADTGTDAGTMTDTGPVADAGPDTATDTATDAGTDTGPVGVELLADPHFQRGFQARHQVSGDIVGTLSPGFAAGAPVWTLGQWGSETTLSDAPATPQPSGAVRWGDAYHAVTIGPAGSSDADLTLYVNAYEEYGGVYRTANASGTWPHLLGEQRISPPGNAGPGCPPLSQLATLDFSVEARLLFDDAHLGAGYDPALHAGHYLMYFTVQNLADPSAPGYGDYLWFGVTLYDDRDPMPGLSVSHDDATGRLIYNIGLSPLSSASLTDNGWHHLSEDLLPHILLALDEAWSLGYLADSQDLADYRIGGMNLGWEVPGLNEAALQIRDLSLSYTTGAGPGPGPGPGDAPPSWGFDTDHDREGWTAQHLVDFNDGPVGGLWVLTADQPDPMLVSPLFSLDAASAGTLHVRMANDGNPVAASHMQIFWSPADAPGFTEANSAWVDVSNGGGWATYTVDLSAQPGWTGTIRQLRIDPIQYGDGHGVGLDSVTFAP